MSDQIISFLGEIRHYFPFVSIMAGLSGSLHCVGMCGGLVTATCERTNDIVSYQFGRLCGYLSLGLLGGCLGGFLSLKHIHPFWSLIPATLLAGIFIFWGMKNLRGQKAEIPTPKFLSHFYINLWDRFVKKNQGLNKALMTGLISIFLPCGLLYGIALGTLTLEHSYEALISMFFFWLGTVPAMIAAPSFIRKLINPLQRRLPKIFGLGLVLIGLMTLGLRVVKVYENSMAVQSGSDAESMICH